MLHLSPFRLFYKTRVESTLNYDKDKFNQEVKAILDDPKGWIKLGYTFEESEKDGALLIQLTSKETISKTFDDTLSYYDVRNHLICINYNNWMGNSKSSLSLNDYKTYVINHEVGHALGYNHPKCHCEGEKGSVMMQMSKGPNFIYPCKENSLPLDNEREIQKAIVGGSCLIFWSYLETLIIILILILALIIILLFIVDTICNPKIDLIK